MYDLRTTRTNAIFEEALKSHRRRVLKSVIHKSESLNQANLAGKPVAKFSSYSRGAMDFEILCDEITRVRI
jgi:cellulose biosynthesis protein BcsQ